VGKYKDRYLKNTLANLTVSAIETVKGELEVRGRMIEEIASKIKTY
jgi:hypothetical protein